MCHPQNRTFLCKIFVVEIAKNYFAEKEIGIIMKEKKDMKNGEMESPCN